MGLGALVLLGLVGVGLSQGPQGIQVQPLPQVQGGVVQPGGGSPCGPSVRQCGNVGPVAGPLPVGQGWPQAGAVFVEPMVAAAPMTPMGAPPPPPPAFPRYPQFRADGPPSPCPSAPAKPEERPNCNWIAIMDKRNCILDWECEPKAKEPCPSPPIKPKKSRSCKWTAIKNSKGCLISYECEPIIPVRGGMRRNFFGGRRFGAIGGYRMPTYAGYGYNWGGRSRSVYRPYYYPVRVAAPEKPVQPIYQPTYYPVPYPVPAAPQPQPQPQPGLGAITLTFPAGGNGVPPFGGAGPIPTGPMPRPRQPLPTGPMPTGPLPGQGGFPPQGGAGGVQPTALPPPVPGADIDQLCCFWASSGECDTNPNYMRPYCQKSCGTMGCTVATASSCRVRVNVNPATCPALQEFGQPPMGIPNAMGAGAMGAGAMMGAGEVPTGPMGAGPPISLGGSMPMGTDVFATFPAGGVEPPVSIGKKQKRRRRQRKA